MGTGRRRPRKPERGRKERRTQTEQGSRRVIWRNSRGSAAARPTLTRDWGGPRVKDPIPVVSVNPQRTDHAQRGQREEKDPNGAREQEGGVEGGQRPYADRQRHQEPGRKKPEARQERTRGAGRA